MVSDDRVRADRAARIQPSKGEKVGLPTKSFLYTLDQIADMLAVTKTTLKRDYVHHFNRDTGMPSRKMMIARNINPVDTDTPEWRVAEQELIRWLRVMGFRVHDAGWVRY